MENKIDFEGIAAAAWRAVAEQVGREIILKHIGSGLDSDVKALIREHAKRMIETDPEIREAIRERLIHWVKEQ